MLAKIHAQRGEYADALEAQRRSIEQLESLRPKIQEHELQDYEAELQARRQRLSDYERLAARKRGDGPADGGWP